MFAVPCRSRSVTLQDAQIRDDEVFLVCSPQLGRGTFSIVESLKQAGLMLRPRDAAFACDRIV